MCLPHSLGKLASVPHVLVPTGLQELFDLGGSDPVQLIQHTGLEGQKPSGGSGCGTRAHEGTRARWGSRALPLWYHCR